MPRKAPWFHALCSRGTHEKQKKDLNQAAGLHTSYNSISLDCWWGLIPKEIKGVRLTCDLSDLSGNEALEK